MRYASLSRTCRVDTIPTMTIDLNSAAALMLSIYLLYIGLLTIFHQPRNATVEAILATLAGAFWLLTLVW